MRSCDAGFFSSRRTAAKAAARSGVRTCGQAFLWFCATGHPAHACPHARHPADVQTFEATSTVPGHGGPNSSAGLNPPPRRGVRSATLAELPFGSLLSKPELQVRFPLALRKAPGVRPSQARWAACRRVQLCSQLKLLPVNYVTLKHKFVQCGHLPARLGGRTHLKPDQLTRLMNFWRDQGLLVTSAGIAAPRAEAGPALGALRTMAGRSPSGNPSRTASPSAGYAAVGPSIAAIHPTVS